MHTGSIEFNPSIESTRSYVTNRRQSPRIRTPRQRQVTRSIVGTARKKHRFAFFPFAFTGVCTKELCYLRDSLAEYEALEAQILAVSVDSPYALARWKEEQQFNFPLLSDFNKTVSKKYDTLYKEFGLGLKGVSKRSAFVIDKEGIVRYAEVLENAGELPNFEAVKQTLQSLNS